MRIQDLCTQDWSHLQQLHRNLFSSRYPEWEDLSQQTFLILWERCVGKEFETLQHLQHYSFVIFRNCYINNYHKSKKMYLTDDLPDMSYSFDEDILDLKRLDISDRLCMWLEGYRLHEIAAKVDRSITSIHKSISKDLEACRTVLSQQILL